jgi:hypothetical protein
MMLSEDKIIEINNQRLLEIAATYNQITGEGCTGDREHIKIPGCPIPELWLPTAMLQEPRVKILIELGFSGILKASETPITPSNLNQLWEELSRIRIKYDFEFFAGLCLWISAKRQGRDILFKLNRAQRYYLTQLETLRLADKPIDIILCKARQWGGSTLTQLYMLWIQLVHRRNWNSVICGDVETQSRNVTGMLDKAMKNLPYWAFREVVTSSPYQGSTSTRVISISQCRFTIGSAQKPDKLRSDDISMAHLTEVGLWKATKGKKPEDLVQSIFGSIASGPYTMRVLESTAKGVGNYFHRTWLDAVAGKNNFTPVFIPWFMIDQDSKPVKDYHTFISEMTEREHYLFSLGATLEALNWYRDQTREMEEWRLCSEFPSTASEAFQSTGRRIFKESYVGNARNSCLSPWWYGDIIRGKLKEEKKKDENQLQIWLSPEESDMRNRYIVSVDVGGVSSKADYSCIVVADRLAMLDGGVPEIAACWHGHIEHDKLAWKAVEIARIYDNALLVIESNTLETDSTEGDNFEYILSEIAGQYHNLYCRTSEQEINQGRPRRWGFHTNSSTKPMVINFLVKALRDGLYIERCLETTFELDTYELKENGKEMGAVEGNHDDRVMATAILVWACYDTPVHRKSIDTGRGKNRTRIISEASI